MPYVKLQSIFPVSRNFAADGPDLTLPHYIMLTRCHADIITRCLCCHTHIITVEVAADPPAGCDDENAGAATHPIYRPALLLKRSGAAGAAAES